MTTMSNEHDDTNKPAAENSDFANYLKIPTVLMGFGLPDDGLHSPNEKYCLDNYYQGIKTVAHFFEKYGAATAAA